MATEKAQAESSSRRHFALIAVATLLLIATGVAYWYSARPSADTAETEASLEAASQIEGAESLGLLKEAYRDAATNDGKARAAMYLATYYNEREDYQKALEYYQDADDLSQQKDINAILGVANAAKEIAQPELAREYFQKAINYYNAHPELPQVEATIMVLQSEIERLN